MAKLDIMGLIGALTGANVPQPNPGYGAQYDYDTGNFDVNGNPVNPKAQALLAQGGTTTPSLARAPYQSPSVLTRLTDPSLAQNIGQANITAEQAPQAAMFQNDINNRVGAARARIAQSAMGVAPNQQTPLQLFTTSGGDVSAPMTQRVAGSEEALRTGLPKFENEADIMKALANKQIDQNQAVQAFKEYISNVPEAKAAATGAQAKAALSGATNEDIFNLANRPNIQPAARVSGIEIGNRGTQALIDQGIGGSTLAKLNDLIEANKNRITGEAYTSRYLPSPSSPIAGLINSDNTVTPGTRVPGYINPNLSQMQQLSDPTLMKSLMSPQTTYTTVDGQKVPAYPGAVSLPASRDAVSATPTNSPSAARPAASAPTNTNGVPVLPSDQAPTNTLIRPATSANNYINNPLLAARDIIGSQIPSQSPNPPAYWQQQINDYNKNQSYREQADNSGQGLDYLNKMLKESKDYYAQH